MALKVENTRSMTDSKKELNQNELTMKKLKRILEVSSVICSTASLNVVIACVYGGVPDIFGFKSEMIFDLAFSLLVASVVLGIFAMATSRIQDRKLEVSFPAHRISTIFSSLFFKQRRTDEKDLAGCEKFSKPVNFQPGKELDSKPVNNMEYIKQLKEKIGNQEYSNSLNNLSMKSSEDAEYCIKNAGKRTVFSPSSDKSSKIKSSPQLQKSHTPFLFGHRSVTQSPDHYIKRKSMQFNLEQIENKSQLVPHLQQDFITNGHLNEVNTRNISEKYSQVGIVSPFKINNLSDVEYCDVYKNLSPSVETIHTSQKHSKERFNLNSAEEQQSFYTANYTGRMPNACFQEESNILYESDAPIKNVHKFPNSQREVFNKRLHTKNLQNLHEVQNTFHTLRCRDSHEVPYTKLLQTLPESSDELSYNRSGYRKFNLHKRQEVDYGDHSYKLLRKVTPNFKNFQHPLGYFKETPDSQIGVINNHYRGNINFEERGEIFEERPDIPMEICDKAPNDHVLEVSMKLNGLNFMY